jgi:hypothetical protein
MNGDRAENAPTISEIPDSYAGSIMMGSMTISGVLVADDLTGVGVADDPLIPVVIGVGVIAASTVSYLESKRDYEIEQIRRRAEGPQGVQYSLRAIESGDYLCYKCPSGTMTLKAGDVWKYGETTNPAGRYSQTDLATMGRRRLEQINEVVGSQRTIKIAEKTKIYAYFIANGHLPPGNKIFR